MAVFLDWVLEASNDGLPLGVGGFHLGQVLLHRFSRDRHAVAVEETRIEKHFHEGEGSTDLDELHHDIRSARLEVGDDGDLFPDPGEVIDGELHPGRIGNRKKVKNGIGRATESSHDGDRVLEGFLRHDVSRTDVFVDEIHHGGSGVEAVHHLFIADGCLGGAVGKAHPECFDRTGHGVGGVHAPARSWSGNRGFGHAIEFLVVDFAGAVFSHGFENGNDVDVFSLEAAGLDRTPIDKNAGTVHPGDRHHAPGHVLVAAPDRDDAVHALASDYGLDGVGDHFPAHKGVFHPFRSHGDPVGNGDRVELDSFSPSRIGSLDRLLGETIDVHVAGRDHAPGRGDPDDGFLEVFVREADRVQHRPAGGTVRPVEHGGGELTMRLGRGFLLGDLFLCCHAGTSSQIKMIKILF